MILGNPITLGGGKKKGRLPEGYRELKYIEGTGQQYINTGLFPSRNYSIKMQFQILGTSGKPAGVMNPNSWAGSYYGSEAWNGNYNLMDNRAVAYTISPFQNIDFTIEYDYFNKKIIVDGSVVASITETIYPISTLYLFTANMNGSPNGTAAMRLESFVAVDMSTGEQVSELVPCADDGNSFVGVFDIERGILIGNSGTGAFVAGPDAEQGIA